MASLSMFNRSLVGWGGHDDKGKSLKSAKEVLNLVKPEWSKELPIRNMTNTVAAVENATFFIFNLNLNLIKISAYFDLNFSMILPNNLIFF